MLNTTFSTRARRAALLALSAGAIGVFAAVGSTQSPRFYPDDPIARAPESQDASKAAPHDASQIFELTYNLFVNSGYKPSGLRAKNLNTIDEVPDSSWFTNRVGSRAFTNEELVRGANVGEPPDPSKWVLDPRENGRRAPRLHGHGRQGPYLVPRVRSAGQSGGRDRSRRYCDQDLLRPRLQPGGIVPDHFRSEEHDDRSEGHGTAPEWQENAVHAR